MAKHSYDCAGMATKYGVLCSDGRTIMPGAFKDQDGTEVPVVWMHQHNSIDNVLGHALLKSCPEGLRAYVVFSPNFENIINSNYYESDRDLKNVALIGGEGEGAERRYTTIAGNGATTSCSGLERRELFVDARDISSKVDDRTLSESEYNAQLQQRGSDKLSETISVTNFEGQIDTTQLYVYGRDFFIGDIVQLANEYEKEASSRVEEIMYTDDTSGISIVPTFTAI